MHIIPHNLLSDERMWAHSCCLTPPHRSRTGTAGWGAWRMLRWVRERDLGRRLPVNFGLLDRFLIWCNYLIIFVQNSCYIVKMWHSILCHYASYVWDLVPAHLVFMFAPGFWTPRIRVWQPRKIYHLFYGEDKGHTTRMCHVTIQKQKEIAEAEAR